MTDGRNTPDDLLARADALLGRHRQTERATPEDDIPVLTDVVQPALPAPEAHTDQPIEVVEPGPAHESPAEDASAAEVVSRVQVQNLEHGVYQKLKRELDDHIEQIVRERFMPQFGAAIDAALQRVAAELHSSLQLTVKSTVDTALSARLPAPEPQTTEATPVTGGRCPPV